MSCSPNVYASGQEVHLYTNFTGLDGVTPIDPTDVVLKVKRGTDATQTFTYSGGEVQRGDTGYYYYDFLPNADGVWVYNFEGTGVVLAATLDRQFSVEPTLFDESP